MLPAALNTLLTKNLVHLSSMSLKSVWFGFVLHKLEGKQIAFPYVDQEMASGLAMDVCFS